MSFLRLLVRNLFYHWRGNLAIFLGIVLGSAVLTGALLVGDSLRGSLKSLTFEQLGWIEEAMVPGRFFRDTLVTDISADRRAAALLLQGSATHEKLRVGKVTVLGIDAAFWATGQVPEGAEFWASEEKEAVINQTLATALGVNVGDEVVLNLQKEDNVPREFLLGKREAKDVIQATTVKVRRILADEGMARFSLRPTPEPVRNAFVPIRMLQRRLDLVGRANAVFVAGATPSLATDLHAKLTLDDWGLRYRSPKARAQSLVRFLAANTDGDQLKKFRWEGRVPDQLAEAAEKNKGILTEEQVIAFYEGQRNYHVLESQRMILEPRVVRAVENLVPRQPPDSEVLPRWYVTPIVIYLADGITDGKIDVPYSIIASDKETYLDKRDGQERPFIADDEIMLVDWPGSPWRGKLGRTVTVSYFSPDEKNHLKKTEIQLKVNSVAALDSSFDDPDLTPVFPGITDKVKMDEWENPPFPYDKKRVKDADEKFWKRYRTTPKAYVNLKLAQKLWGSRFGDVTSMQFRLGTEHPDFFPQALLAELTPEQGGFTFQPVKAQALSASSGVTDFGVLFLSFSFFLIVAALLLVGLLVRLNLDRRAGEIGLLLALGWSHRRVHWLLLAEGILLGVLGAAVGLAGAMAYAHLMLKLLAANWPGGEALSFLRVHAEPVSFAIGFSVSLVVSLVTLYWATRVLGQSSPLALLQGATLAPVPLGREKTGCAPIIAILALLVAGMTIVLGIRSGVHQVQAAMFFVSGALMLIAGVAVVWVYLAWQRNGVAPQPTVTGLGLRNAGRQAVRSVLTVGLLASASFLIVAVESFHKNTDQHFHDKTGGSGGFAFFAEGSVPVFEDISNEKVRAGRLDTAELQQARFYACRVQAGDDASCLGLYKPLKPRVMGVSKALIERGGFHFATSQAQDDAQKANPWLLLQSKTDGTIPAIIDANTAQWILKVGVGDTIDVNDGDGTPVKLRIVALLHESIFQSEVLIAEEHFLTLFPRQEGFTFFLIDVGEADPPKLKIIEQQLGKGLEAFNLDVQTTASRLQGYLAVENMYLATFQALGGLGLILGAAGLAIVLLRGVWERRAELALLLALGFRPSQLAGLVLVENAFLLALGLAVGTVSALLAVAPHLVGAGAHVLWLRIVVLLVLVLVAGLASAALAVWSTLKTPVLTALRRE
ncbi:MAG: FtsX-like permease family protein [Gemmataceae bacterium]|nr:FtsX-like permease family protein [Gemmataceae bacterium]